MTFGEKLVWASVFSTSYCIRLKGNCPYGDDERAREWVEDKVFDAIEDSCVAVQYLRESINMVNKTKLAKEEDINMLKEMLNE